MDGGAGREADPQGDPDAPALTPAVLADLQAGLLDDTTAARVRHRVRSDPAAVRILTHLDSVQRDLTRLATDEHSAPDVPADVTVRIGAALRRASGAPGHTVARPSLTRTHRITVAVGLIAAGAAVIVGALMLTRAPERTFPAGPTASQITVPTPGFPIPEAELRALLSTPADLGALTDPQRLASCLAGLGHSPTERVLGGRAQHVGGRPAVVLVLPGPTAGRVSAVVVSPSCSAADTGLVSRTVLDRP